MIRYTGNRWMARGGRDALWAWLWVALAMVWVSAAAWAGDNSLRSARVFPALTLTAPERGEAAIRALGERLPQVAEWYLRTPDELKATLRRDSTAWIDRAGRWYYVETEPTVAPRASATGTATTSTASAAYPTDQTFLLHSRPAAKRVIYLDFNGDVTSGTAWNSAYGLSAIDAQAFDLDGIPSSFSTTELERIQYIWQRVAEDFAPFDVDVTTEAPPADEITRSSSSDEYFGTRVVVTKDWTVNTASPCNCAGFAYVGVFDDLNDYYKPAYVFFDRLGSGNEKYVAEAVSHETGHNLGLEHDGTTTGSEYYAGHGSGATGWAPIMGSGYYKELVQWSKGEYPYANNLEDDLARMPTFGAPAVVDDHANSLGAATPLQSTLTSGTVALSGTGVVGARGDTDVFSFASGAGSISLNIVPGPRGPNLDLRADLYDASGVLVSSVNPVDALNASLAVSNANPGTYYLKIDGVGKGDLSTGYSDYASLGQYSISGSAPAPNGQPPVAKATATPTSGTVPLTVSFSSAGSYDPDGTAVTYKWNFGDGSALSTAANPVHVYATTGNFTAILTVTDASGAGTLAQRFISVTSVTPTLSVQSIAMALSVKFTGTRATATVTIVDATGKVLSGASVKGTWSGVVSGTGTVTTGSAGTAKFTSPSTTAHGTFTFTVNSVTLAGYSYAASQNKQTSASITY